MFRRARATAKRQQLFFTSRTEANTACEKLRARNDNFGVSLTAMTTARIAEAAEAYKLLDGYQCPCFLRFGGFWILTNPGQRA